MSKEKANPRDLENAARRMALEFLSPSRDTVSEHPEIDALIAYQEGRLQNPDAEAIRQHLEACPDCAEELLELEALSAEDSEKPEFLPPPEITAEDRAIVQARLRREAPVESFPRMPTAEPKRTEWPRWSLAAMIVLALLAGFFLGRGFGAPETGETVVKLEGTSNPFLLELFPEEEGRQRGDGIVSITPPATTDILVVRLLWGDLTPYESYRAEIVSEQGDVVWAGEKIERQPTGELVLLVPAAQLPAGQYRLDLKAAHKEPLAVYFFDIAADSTE